MCIIIDTNTFNSVFDVTSPEHVQFAPVLEWIINGKGKIVYGGTKYKEELKQASKYLKIFGQFHRSRKVVTIDDASIDAYQKILEEKEKDKDFDDPHLVAICYISKCRIICTGDKRSFPFMARKDFYPNNSPRPKLYTKNKNADLLCDNLIAEICNPCVKLKKGEIEKLKENTAKIA